MRFRAAALALALCASTFTQPAIASYNGVIDYSNARIVPMFRDLNQDSPGWSGYLYAPRIIFTAGHGELNFDSNGNKIDYSNLPAYAGLPNSKVSNDSKKFTVVKKWVSTSMRYDGATLGDFAIYVVGEDIADVPRAKLATREIAKELEAARAIVEITGYGDYQDRCKEGDQLPCPEMKNSRSLEPRKLKVQLRPYEDFLALVGYERPQLKTSQLTWGGGKISPCGGDSGGSVTTTYKGEEIYLSVTPNGMNGYACGAAGYYDGKGGIGYASPIYDHLDILQAAEDYVAAALAKEAEAKAALAKKKSTITCVKGKTSKKVTAVSPKCPAGYKKK